LPTICSMPENQHHTGVNQPEPRSVANHSSSGTSLPAVPAFHEEIVNGINDGDLVSPVVQRTDCKPQQLNPAQFLPGHKKMSTPASPQIAQFRMNNRSGVLRNDQHNNIPVKPIAQLQAIIGKDLYERADLYKLLEKRLKKYENEILTSVVRYSLIPMLEDNVAKFQDMELFDLIINTYLEAMNEHILVLTKSPLSEMIREEISFQKKMESILYLDKSLTTCGFEFEFLQTTEDSVLAGLSHVELASSKDVFGHTGLPFKVETDSACEMELITPPFMIPTIGRGSLPHPDLLDIINNKFTKGLLPLQLGANKLSKENDEKNKGIPGLLNLLANLLGVNMKLNPDIINIQNVSYNIGKKGKEVIRDKEGKLSMNDLSKIEFKEKNEKYKEKNIDIASQINFSASAQMLGIMLSRTKLKEDQEFHGLYTEWYAYLLKKAPDLPIDYIELMLQKLVSLYVVPMQGALLDELKNLYGIIQKDDKMPSEEKLEWAQMCAMRISYVKDVKPLWVKDDLSNITQSYLDDDKVKNSMKDFTIDDFPYEALDNSLLTRLWPDAAKEVNKAYKKNCSSAFGLVRYVCKNPYPETPQKKIKFLEHSSDKIGARQDTYLYLNEKTNAKGSDRRYVGEIRDGKTDTLHEMAKLVKMMEEANYEEDYSKKSKIMETLKKEASLLYLPPEIDDKEMEDPMANYKDTGSLLSYSDTKNSNTKEKRKKHKKDKKEKKENDDQKDMSKDIDDDEKKDGDF